MPSSITTSSAEAAIAAAIPDDVNALCRRLQEAGFSAVVVGGAVRDLLRRALSKSDAEAKDFDVATAAPPEEVVRIFGARRTIPTGIAHGTVTVLGDRLPGAAQHARSRHVEVTTFRGETGYSDGRRPDQVQFIDDLVEDLRRRDFTINAIAFDPIRSALHDPFDGRGDLDRGIIRAVGDPAQRFAEDGLRLLRAVRFAAQLGFTIDSETRAAFTAALPTLRKVSRERVRDEICKLLAAKKPSLGLQHMLGPTECSLIGVVLPEVSAVLATPAFDADRLLEFVDAAAVKDRLAALLWPMRRAANREPLKQLANRIDELLKLPAKDRQHLASLLSFAEPEYSHTSPWPAPTLRRLLSQHAPELVDDFIALRRGELEVFGEADALRDLNELSRRIVAERAENPPLSTADLALTGKELCAGLGLRPGPSVGVALRHLLEFVLDDPRRNDQQTLLAEAARLLRTNEEPAS